MAEEIGDPKLKRNAREELALALSDCGHHDEAVQHMRAIVNEEPSNAISIGNLGWVLYDAGDYDRSIEASSRALELDPAQTWTIRNLAHAYLAKGLPDEAHRQYLRAIRDRKGGEDFFESIIVVKKLLEQSPTLPRGKEMLELLEQEQSRLQDGRPPAATPSQGF